MEKLTEYWYLRDGDFMPEKIETLCSSWKRSRKTVAKFLAQNNNLFASRDKALAASKAVKAILSSLQAPPVHL